MLVSPPIEAAAAAGREPAGTGSIAENFSPEHRQKTRGVQKGGLGVFAKLLAGLLRNTHAAAGQDRTPEHGPDAADFLINGVFPGVPTAPEFETVSESPGGPEKKIRIKNPGKAEFAGGNEKPPLPSGRNIPAGLALIPERAPGTVQNPGENPGLPEAAETGGNRLSPAGSAGGKPAVNFREGPKPLAGGESAGPAADAAEGLPGEKIAGQPLPGARGREDPGNPEPPVVTGEPEGREGRAGDGRTPAAGEESGTPYPGAPAQFRAAGELRNLRGNEKTGDSKGEARNRDKRRERFSLEVRDLRTPQAEGKLIGDELRSTPGPGKDHEKTQGPRGETELLVELRSGSAKTQGEISAEGENRPVLSFRDMLARELHQNLNNDIVRHGSILLRNGGEGLIKLSLKPESLGNVKIRLEMAENKVTGHIIVESDEALRAFEREIHALEQAFRDSGYEGVSFDIAHTADQGRQERQWKEGELFFVQPLAAAAYDTAGDSPANGIPEPGLTALSPGQPRINMLV
jgi:hypothetical protein